MASYNMREEKKRHVCYSTRSGNQLDYTTSRLDFGSKHPLAIYIIPGEKSGTYSARADTNRAFTINGRWGKLLE